MTPKTMAELWQTSHISGGNSAYVESIFEEFLQDPSACPEPWKSYFENLPQLQVDSPDDLSHATVRDHFLLLAKTNLALFQRQPLLYRPSMKENNSR